MADQSKFHWAERVSRRDIQRLYRSDAQGLLDEELLEQVHYAIYARVCDMLEVQQAQTFGRLTCRQCGQPIPQPYQMGSRGKDKLLRCETCGWQVTCGEYYVSYNSRSLLPGSVTDLFESYMERFEQVQTPPQKMLLMTG